MHQCKGDVRKQRCSKTKKGRQEKVKNNQTKNIKDAILNTQFNQLNN